MIYEVYAGGIHAVQAKFDVDLRKKDRYDIKMSAKTRGFLAKWAPWNGVFESHGWILGRNKDKYQPELHKSTTTWRDETEVKEYKYTKDGGFEELMITDHEKPSYKKEIDSELTYNTTDAFSAALQVMKAISVGQGCSGSSEVFDGKRRFEQIFHHKGVKQLKSSSYNIYEGEAAECTVEVKPIAGAWHKKPRGFMSIQEQGRERGMMPTVWMAKMSDEGPAIPVKVRVKTQYGTLFMHLSEYKNGDEIIIAEKRAYNED